MRVYAGRCDDGRKKSLKNRLCFGAGNDFFFHFFFLEVVGIDSGGNFLAEVYFWCDVLVYF